MRYTIYMNSKSNWYNKLKDYANKNEWTISHAIGHIVEGYFNKAVMPKLSDIPMVIDPMCKKDTIYMVRDAKPKKQKPIKKLDPEEYFAKIEAKIIPKNSNVDDCDRRTIDSGGKYSCYFFDQGRAYFPYCIKDCWTSELYWGKRVRK
jgi:hypothetical protein